MLPDYYMQVIIYKLTISILLIPIKLVRVRCNLYWQGRRKLQFIFPLAEKPGRRYLLSNMDLVEEVRYGKFNSINHGWNTNSDEKELFWRNKTCTLTYFLIYSSLCWSCTPGLTKCFQTECNKIIVQEYSNKLSGGRHGLCVFHISNRITNTFVVGHQCLRSLVCITLNQSIYEIATTGNLMSLWIQVSIY
jgi:hypothetical protein